MSTGCLYLCATPIGNREDISARVLRVLEEADLIAAEDTRHSRGLLQYYDKVDENLNEAQIDALCAQYLKYYNRVLQTVTLESMGITGIRAGMIIPVLIEDVESLTFNRLLLAEKVTHTYEGSGYHTMSVEVKSFDQLGGG